MFRKDTIIGRALLEVNTNVNNKHIINKISKLILRISDLEYIDYEGPIWSKNGLTITDIGLSKTVKKIEHKNWSFVETTYKNEFSWLVFELKKIYNPDENSSMRLYSTLGYLFEVYSEMYDNIDKLLIMVTIVSTIWLHPDHVGQDRFMVHPINLPNFGNEF